MDRVLIGKAEANNSPYYHRSNKFGVYVSKPGANVLNCSDGDLIFDSNLPTGLFETIGQGFVRVPKAKYNLGIFGEEGVITESNWDSNEDIPELNRDTSWLFEAMDYLYADMQDAISGLYQFPQVFRLRAGPTSGFGVENPLNQFSTATPETSIAFGLRTVSDDYLFTNLRTHIHYGSAVADQLINIGQINSDVFVKTMIRDLWRIYDVFPFLNTGNGGLFSISENNVNYIGEFGALNVNQTIDQAVGTVPAGSNLYSLPPKDIFENNDYFKALTTEGISEKIQSLSDVNSVTDARNYVWSKPFKALWGNLFDENLFYDGQTAKQRFFSKTAYISISNSPIAKVAPTPWRAWTNPDGSRFTLQEEIAAIAKYMKYVYICSLLTRDFGTNVNSYPLNTTLVTGVSSISSTSISKSKFGGAGILDKASPFVVTVGENDTPRSATLYNYGRYDFSQIDTNSDGIYLHCFKTTCPNTKTWDELKSLLNVSNYSYSYWDLGEANYNTGISAQTSKPPHVWWNAVTRSTTNATTNIPFMNVRNNVVKYSEESKRGFSLRPGLPSMQANTFVDSEGNINVKFVQPSVLDETDVYFTIYRQDATYIAQSFLETLTIQLGTWNQTIPLGSLSYTSSFKSVDTAVVEGVALATSAAVVLADPIGDDVPVPLQQKGIANFVFDIRHTSDGGNSIVNRKSSDGRYYTSVFPDDFVGQKFSDTDPFILYRDSDGKIDQPLNIILQIPFGVTLSGNSFHNHITWNELQKTSGTKSVSYGPKDTAGRVSESIYACVDPCIKLNMNSGEFSNNALLGFNVVVENYGTMIGAGGWGQYGQMYFDATKYQTAYPGGGGGGGAGYHPQLASENPKVDWLGADGITAEDRLDGNGDPIFVGSVNTTEEIALAQTAVLTHWNGPNNYVEWGIGYFGRLGTYYTGLDEITWNSIGPGKPGTGYMGATEEYHTSLDSLTNRPYGLSQDRWSNNQFGVITDTNIYERLPGTFSVQTGSPRYFIDGWGNPGTYGSTTIGGKGGGEKSVLTFGYPQYTPFGSSDALSTFSGSGGSCVYVYSNTAQNSSGLGVQLINYDGGIIKAGGGGGSGGIGVPGLPGGKLGRPGGYIAAPLYPSLSADSGRESIWSQYSRRGEPGRLVWWNAPNLANNYYIRNYSTSSSGAVEGMEYNYTIESDDYVSYLPDVSILHNGNIYSVSGKRLFSRMLVNGQVQYHEMQERTYEDYINQTSDKEFV